jgi:hypothetical protein
MKTHLHYLMVLTALAGLPLDTAQAAGSKLEILGDAKLAALTGGFCFNEQCETGTPSGACQPFPADQKNVCDGVGCFYETSVANNVDTYGCKISNSRETCTEDTSYRACVVVNFTSICIYSGNTTCGTVAEPGCYLDYVHRICVCSMQSGLDRCDWSDCLE